MVFRLKPRDERFYEYFEEMADIICEASKILKTYFEEKHDPIKTLEKLLDLEHRGDQIFATTIKQINNTYMPPFDREDIINLTQELDNILDHIHGTMDKIVLYKAGHPREKHILKLVSVLEEATDEIREAMTHLRKLRSNHDQILEQCDKIRLFEQEGDYLYRTGIAILFDKTENVIDIIKWKEIYEHLETTFDYCENVSNVVKAITVKYV
ncbi:Phosphate transport regulator [Candidatus Syntrophocurvum alkaliphilum]|uniref:Phosphate transport regulator n=1 Tax=Candidatus Syntrophocurvum alkaliphilum TaxID=2293317 RepID=A0A6I6DKE3_9FIRM|nr:DUF47 family protein [Candidatus Syntrophocurvum alkaliphilum]QGU00055.1 Phosphate transport regulator [Candidatus Syntrophocurvum alkaliphilum]